MSDNQSNLTDKEMEDLQNIVTDTLANVCAMADKHSIDRDSILKYFADMLTAFAELASIQNYETNHTCNCKHNSNSRVKVNSLEIIVRMIGNKPYYELKYRQVGKKDYSIGYSSYDLKIVLGYIDTYFEIVESDNHTNADIIRNMSDEELVDTLFNSFLEYMHIDECPYADMNVGMCKKCISEWLQSETE